LCSTLCLTSRLGFNEVNIFEHGKLLLFALLEFHGDNNACCKPGHLLSPHAFGAGIRTLRSLLPHPSAVCAILIFSRDRVTVHSILPFSGMHRAALELIAL